MRKLFALLSLTIGLFTQAADAPAPEQLLRNTTRDVLETIKKDNLKPNDARFRELIESKVVPLFDFNRLTALAVGRPWRAASSEQQAALTREFRTLLIRTYSTAFSANKIADIEVKPVKLADADADTDAIVKTEVKITGSQALPIDYKLGKQGSAWKVYDVSIEGVSLVTNYRSNFGQVIQKDGMDGLIKALTERNAAQLAKVSK